MGKKKHLKLFVVVLSLLFSLSSQAAKESTTDHFVISDLTLAPGGDAGYFDVSLVGTSICYSAYQLDIILPQCVSVDFKNDAPRVSALRDLHPLSEDQDTGDRNYTHTLLSDYGSNGTHTLRVECYSPKATTFTANSGRLFRVYIKASNYAKAGAASIKITNALLVWSDGNTTKGYAPSDQTLTNVKVEGNATINVNISSDNKFSTAIFPFDIDCPDGLKVYKCNSCRDGEENYLALVNDKSIHAYTPYILYAENGFTGSITAKVPETENYPSDNYVVEGYLHGALEDCTADAGYILQNQGAGARFYRIDSENGDTFTIPEGRCWLVRSDAIASAKSLMFWFGDEDDATDMRDVIGSMSTNSTSVFYDLGGRKIGTPQVGGIYVIGGQKVLKVK